MRDLVILGAGPAGWTAAIYAARAQLRPLVIAGLQPGGQLTLTAEVENFPGFPDGILGRELVGRMQQQAEKFGTEVLHDEVAAVDFSRLPLKLTASDGTVHEALAVIVATGASARWLGLPEEERLRGRGLSACATCDGFFFKDRHVAVIGGGDAAVEEALFLTRFAATVTLVHRRRELRAARILRERALAHPKLRFAWDSVVVGLEGDDRVTGMRLRNVATGAVTTLPVDGVFVAIGHVPNTAVFRGQLELDAHGHIVVFERTCTSRPGVFAAGDVADPRYRQAVVAAGSGARAALDAQAWIEMQSARPAAA